ncbi:MAG: FecR domain-containing protein [Thermodesulfobacteriota bacterium]
MRFLFKTAWTLTALCLLLNPCLSRAQSQAVTIETVEGNTVVSMLQGQAYLIKEDLTRIRALARGDYLKPDDRVQTEKNSRVELKLPDGSFIRFDEMTIFVLKAAAYDRAQKQRDIDVTMIIGKIWAKVAKLINKEDRFAVSAHTAVAGVRGTTYRMNVNQDNSAMVKVYDGEVEVRGRRPETAAAQPPRPGEPSVIQGPRPIPGPRPVTMQEWTYIVGAMQQINIQPDGTPSEPFRFSPEVDLDDWVRWNMDRDR